MIASLVLALAAPVALQGPESALAKEPKTLTAEEARSSYDQAMRFLIDEQQEDGSFSNGVMDTVQELGFSVASFYAWKVAADAIATLALLHGEETPEVRAALDKAVERLHTQPLPQRGNDWDTDYGWGILYAFVAVMEIADDARFQGEDQQARLEETAGRYLDVLQRLQSPNGGWAYYDNPIFSRRPTWDTSFCTALVLPSLYRAIQRGWLEDEAVLERARTYVRKCARPGGAYAYSWRPLPRINLGGESIDRVKGSLSRIQVCNWGLAMSGEDKVTLDVVREGLQNFFEHHRFLEAARMRPIPHEAYYANAGYFYMFGHYYAAEAIELLPEDEREGWHAKLRPLLIRAQRPEGYAIDFIEASYQRVAGTGMLALGLALGLDGSLGE